MLVGLLVVLMFLLVLLCLHLLADQRHKASHTCTINLCCLAQSLVNLLQIPQLSLQGVVCCAALRSILAGHLPIALAHTCELLLIHL